MCIPTIPIQTRSVINIMTAQLIIQNNIIKYVNSLYTEAKIVKKLKLTLFFMKTNLCSTDPVNLDEKVLLKMSFFSPACYSSLSSQILQGF